MKLFGKIKGVMGDLIYSIIGLVVMHGVIQFVLYPTFNSRLGAEQFGTVLTLISVISIMSATFGTAANYSRIVCVLNKREAGGDFNLFLSVIAIIAVPVSIVSVYLFDNGSPVYCAGYFLLMVVTIIRYYADVEFRINVNYKRFLVYYLLISVGYLLGIAGLFITGSWVVAMLLGEVFAVLFVVIKGQVFRCPLFKPSQFARDNFKSLMIMSGTEIIITLILNADRLLLQVFVDSTAVTVFYAATLMGKMISLISVPFNGVLIGHLARYEGKLKSSTFAGLSFISIGVGLVINVVCTAVSYVFVKFMYPDIFEAAKAYFFVANLGQILYFISNTLTVILLKFSKEKYQLYINVVYMFAFLVIGIPATIMFGLWGLAWSLIAVNLIKILVIVLVGKKVLCQF